MPEPVKIGRIETPVQLGDESFKFGFWITEGMTPEQFPYCCSDLYMAVEDEIHERWPDCDLLPFEIVDGVRFPIRCLERRPLQSDDKVGHFGSAG